MILYTVICRGLSCQIVCWWMSLNTKYHNRTKQKSCKCKKKSHEFVIKFLRTHTLFTMISFRFHFLCALFSMRLHIHRFPRHTRSHIAHTSISTVHNEFVQSIFRTTYNYGHFYFVFRFQRSIHGIFKRWRASNFFFFPTTRQICIIGWSTLAKSI